MTANEFQAICMEYTINPDLVIDDDRVQDCIRTDDIDRLRELLQNEF